MSERKPFPWIQLFGGLVAMGCCWAATGVSHFPFPLPDLAPPDDAPNLVAVFSQATAEVTRDTMKVDARSFADVCKIIAEILELDGKQGEHARINTGQQLAIFRDDARSFRTNYQSLSPKYPRLREVVEHFLDDAAGKDGGALTEESRAKWVHAFRTLSKAAEYAERKL